MEAASLLWNQRTPASVRAASRAYLRVAEASDGRIAPLVEAVRAEVWLADHDLDDAARRDAAARAVQAAQWCARLRPGDPGCDYWLAVALGVQARERRSTGLDALPRIVDLLERSVESAPDLEHAGPHRVLALVLLRAPGWPRGPGDPDLGLEHARRAVERWPDHAPNQLCLAEALEKTEDPTGSVEAYREAARLAREGLHAGVSDAAEWLRSAEDALGSASDSKGD